MQPLIIIATPNICWLNPDVDYPHTPQDIAEEARLCYENGATILHTHAVGDKPSSGQWAEVIRAVRQRSDIVVQCGMSSLPIQDRLEVFKNKADMISIILNHHDEAFARTECLVLHPRQELEEYAQLCKQHGVIAEYEVWHAGSVWNLNYLIGKKLIEPPYVTTLFFGWPGGTWSPPTVEEYLYRRKLMPEGCVCNVSIMGKERGTVEQRDLITAAILMGDHVRVGTEDYPYNHQGEIITTHELVRETAEIARALGRPLADIMQTRDMIGLSR
jgi:3-keto-5-aminohexanoate cleavage enzyme